MKGTQREIPSWFVASLLVLAGARVMLETGIVRLPAPGAPELVAWREHDEAREVAREAGKPLLIEFTADWCAPCGRMDRETFADQGVADAIARGFVAARVVNSQDPAVATKGEETVRAEFGVEAFPTLVVVVPGQARPVIRTGFMPPGEMRRFLDAARLKALAARNAAARRARRM